MNKSYYEQNAIRYQHKAALAFEARRRLGIKRMAAAPMAAYYAARARFYLFQAIDTEMYQGFFIGVGEPQYGDQFAIAWGHENDDGRVHHCHTRAEARAEIDDLLHDRAEYEKAKQS